MTRMIGTSKSGPFQLSSMQSMHGASLSRFQQLNHKNLVLKGCYECYESTQSSFGQLKGHVGRTSKELIPAQATPTVAIKDSVEQCQDIPGPRIGRSDWFKPCMNCAPTQIRVMHISIVRGPNCLLGIINGRICKPVKQNKTHFYEKHRETLDVMSRNDTMQMQPSRAKQLVEFDSKYVSTLPRCRQCAMETRPSSAELQAIYKIGKLSESIGFQLVFKWFSIVAMCRSLLALQLVPVEDKKRAHS